MGQTAWFTTAYFVDPLVICNGGRLLQNNLAEAEKPWARVKVICCHYLQTKFIIVGWNWNSCEIWEKHILQELKRLWKPRNWRSSFDPNRNDQEPGEHPAHAGWGRHELWLVRLTHHYHFNKTWINFVNFSPLFFSGMITSVSLAWEITTSNSTTLLIRFNLTWSTTAPENMCF